MSDLYDAVQKLANACVQMYGCGEYTPEDVDELELAAWEVIKAFDLQEEIVRCKNCKYKGFDNCPLELYWENHPADDNAYCSFGER